MPASIPAFHRVALAAVAALALAGLGWWTRHAPAPAAAPATIPAGGTVVRATRPLMGSVFEIAVWAPAGKEPGAAEAARAGLDLVAALEEKISEWKPSSEISAVNAAAGGGPVKVGPETRELVGAMVEWARKTGGAFDVTGGPLFRRWESARKEKNLPSHEEIAALRSMVGWDKIEVSPGAVRLAKAGMAIGTGAIGKGWAADKAGAMLESLGFPDYIIDAGGDLRIGGSRGGEPWTVAVKEPRREGFLATIAAAPGGIATSGDYERFWFVDGVRYSHILDLRTGWPARGLASVTIISRDGVSADALATAVFAMGPEKGLEFANGLEGVEAMLVREDGGELFTRGLRRVGDRLEVIR